MRGKAVSLSSYCLIVRITPAHAGKRVPRYLSSGRPRDHPRPCGEKLRVIHLRLIVVRITPAHAGKRWARRTHPHNAWDHPRPCGEKALSSKGYPSSTGSPPPMRGKARAVHYRHALPGITPAHAGKRRMGAGRMDSGRDHPRPCGEKLIFVS